MKALNLVVGTLVFETYSDVPETPWQHLGVNTQAMVCDHEHEKAPCLKKVVALFKHRLE
jgi:hypothetical protein